MSVQSKDEERILSIVAEASNWSEEEIKANLKNCLPVLNKFILSTEDIHIGIQVIRFAFGSFLPHLSLATLSDKLLNTSLPSLSKYLQCLLEELEKEDGTKARENLECLILCVECCGVLLNYLLHQDQQGNHLTLEHIDNAPNILINIIKSSLQHYMQKNELYQNAHDLEGLLQSLLKEIADGCSLVCEIVAKIEWFNEDHNGINALAEVCESLSEIAHCLSCVSELRVSVTAWKTFGSLVQSYSEELKRRIVLSTTVQFLNEEICEGLLMLKSFEKGSGTNLDENEEKVFVRVLKRSGFNLKISIVISEKFSGFLRDTHSHFLSLILTLLSYSTCGFAFKNLPDGFKAKIDEQLFIGIYPLLSHLRQDKEFIDEVAVWCEKRMVNTDSHNVEQLNSSSEFAAYLLLLIALIKQTLSDPLNGSHTKLLEPIVLKNIFQILSYCHPELSYPQMLPGVMHDGHAQEKTSFYSHTLMYTCGFVSILDEKQFKKAEHLLFQNVLSGESWKSLLASDILCFIARYGSASLCENHCVLLMKLLKANPSMNLISRRSALSLLARLLAFVKTQTFTEILSNWILDNPEKVFVAEVVYTFTSQLKEELQKVADEYILSNWKEDVGVILDSNSAENIRSLLYNLNATRLYCRSSAIEVTRIESTITSSIVATLIKIFQRFPSSYINCSLVSKLFCLALESASPFIEIMTTEDIYTILIVCEEIILSCSPDALICLCDFFSSLGLKEFGQSDYLEDLLKKISGVFVNLLTHSNAFVHMSSIKALVSFAQYSKYEEIFASCISQLDKNISEEVTRFLQLIPEEEPKGRVSVEAYLKQQMNIICASFKYEGKRRGIPVRIPLEAKEKLKRGMTGNEIGSSDKEGTGVNINCSKRRKVEAIDAKNFIAKLDEVKDILSHNETLLNMQHDENITVKTKLLELLNMWESHCEHI